ncbi:MAG: lysophospholipid acyltransferase family protein [Planctomycetota bacterium]
MSLKAWKKKAVLSLVYPVYRSLALSWRIGVEGGELLEELERSGHPFIYAIMHGRLLIAAIHGRQRGIVILTSQHADGELGLHFARRMGFRGMRGSTSRGGTKALLMLCRLPGEVPIAVAADGPRGPEGSVKEGIVQLARLSGRSIMPVGIGANRLWRLKSWDRFAIPKPFAKVQVVYGAPILIPRGTARSELGSWVRGIERDLREVDRRAWDMAGNQDPTAPLPLRELPAGSSWKP